MCDRYFNSNHGDIIYIYIYPLFSLREYFSPAALACKLQQKFANLNTFPPIPLYNGRNLQYLHQNFSATSFLVRLHCNYDLQLFLVHLYCLYYLYYLVLRCSSDLCAAIVQLYRTYYLYYLLLRVSSYLSAAYLYYFDALTQIIRALAAPTKLVPANASCHPPPLKSQWWRSCSARLPSTVDLPVLPCPHRVHLTSQDFQACPSKPFLTNKQIAFSQSCIFHQITSPSKPFPNQQTKR